MLLPKKILILGSGALKIGEAGEFDYSGSQAIKAFKEEGIKTVLVNPNIATIQTSDFLADEIYFLPVNAYFVEKVIQKEKPDAITISFGGQTALNCGMDLYKKGILKKYHVRILGTPIESVVVSEDRKQFATHLQNIKVKIPPSSAARTAEQAIIMAKRIGLPVMVRAGYALGGHKSGVAYTEIDLKHIATDALTISSHVLIEKYLHHYKEIEYEIVRDIEDNCIAVCNMENMDPLGIHTGESIVVAPSQTLTNSEYHFLRKVAIDIVKSLKVVGECNVQFALNPLPKKDNLEYYVIEMNARLSRSSALASKATGYPLAYVAAKLSLGKNLMEIQNQVTRATQSFFEPALDYLVIKIPRWDLEKFKGAEEKIGSNMKSVGEVMAIGRTFEEAIQKAVRMLDIGVEGVTDIERLHNEKTYQYYIDTPTPKRLFAITEELRKGISVQKVYQTTGIDPWFLYRLKNIADFEINMAKRKIVDKGQLLCAKQLGFSDKKIGELIGKTELEIRSLRKKYRIKPSVFQIDTLAGEVPAKTNYLYTTYNGSHHDVEPLGRVGIMVLGSGAYRIGSSVEFDWSCVNTAMRLKKYNKKSIIINCNPETVSTDYDISDRLYFDELSLERVLDIYEFENSAGVIVSVGGQTPNNLVDSLSASGVTILGTQAKDINQAEDRNKFSQLLDKLQIKQPQWNTFTTFIEALKFSHQVGYPVLVRPSYVLSGSAMSLCFNDVKLKELITKASKINEKYPVIISKFISDAKEIEFDGVAEKGEIKVYAISEHIENAGVHSGDASIMYPVLRVYLHTEKQMIKAAEELVKALNITGPFNIQFIAKDNNVFVIEMNVRASRTFPFLSKAIGINFAQVIMDCLFGKSRKYEIAYPDYFTVKVPQFSFARLAGADPVLRVEMASTGEVACFGKDADSAYLKAIYSTGVQIKNKGALITLGGILNKEKFLESVWQLKNMGFILYATSGTFKFLKGKGIRTKLIHKVYEDKRPHVVDIIEKRQISLIFILSEKYEEHPMSFESQITDGYLIRRAAVDNNIPMFTDLQAARFFVKAMLKYPLDSLTIESYKQYVS